MKVTKTKTETTMYDTNGNKISIVLKEVLEVNTQTHLLNRTESKQVKEKVTIYRDKLTQAKKIKNQLEKTHGIRKGCKIFSSMADLIMIVENPNRDTITVNMPKKLPDNHLILEVAETTYSNFQGPLKKKK